MRYGLVLVLGMLFFPLGSVFGQKLQEADYIQLINQHFRGEREKSVCIVVEWIF